MYFKKFFNYSHRWLAYMSYIFYTTKKWLFTFISFLICLLLNTSRQRESRDISTVCTQSWSYDAYQCWISSDKLLLVTGQWVWRSWALAWSLTEDAYGLQIFVYTVSVCGHKLLYWVAMHRINTCKKARGSEWRGGAWTTSYIK